MEKTKIKESELDEVIEKGRAYYKDDTKFDPYFNASFKAFGRNHHWIDNILRGLFFKSDNYNEPKITFYKVFEALGFEIIEG